MINPLQLKPTWGLISLLDLTSRAMGFKRHIRTMTTCSWPLLHPVGPASHAHQQELRLPLFKPLTSRGNALVRGCRLFTLGKRVDFKKRNSWGSVYDQRLRLLSLRAVAANKGSNKSTARPLLATTPLTIELMRGTDKEGNDRGFMTVNCVGKAGKWVRKYSWCLINEWFQVEMYNIF